MVLANQIVLVTAHTEWMANDDDYIRLSESK